MLFPALLSGRMGSRTALLHVSHSSRSTWSYWYASTRYLVAAKDSAKISCSEMESTSRFHLSLPISNSSARPNLHSQGCWSPGLHAKDWPRSLQVSLEFLNNDLEHTLSRPRSILADCYCGNCTEKWPSLSRGLLFPDYRQWSSLSHASMLFLACGLLFFFCQLVACGACLSFSGDWTTYICVDYLLLVEYMCYFTSILWW